MDGDGVIIQGRNSFDYLPMDLTGNQHDEGKALLLVVVLNHEVVEISTVLDVLIEDLDAPAFLVVGEDCFGFSLAAGLQHVHAERLFAFFEAFLSVALLPEFHAVKVIVTALFVFIDIPVDIDLLMFGDFHHPEFDAGMFLPGMVIEAARILDIGHGPFEYIRI